MDVNVNSKSLIRELIPGVVVLVLVLLSYWSVGSTLAYPRTAYPHIQNQDKLPPPPLPSVDYTWACTALNGGPPFTAHFSKFPVDQLTVNSLVNPNPPTDGSPLDTVSPVISSVIYTGGASVLTGLVKIPPTSTSIPITVKATDNKAVSSMSLYVDDYLVTVASGGNSSLPTTVNLRWNTANIDAGLHKLKLSVWDKAGNQTDSSWVMTK